MHSNTAAPSHRMRGAGKADVRDTKGAKNMGKVTRNTVEAVYNQVQQHYMEMLFSMYERWQDEKMYEDIKDYVSFEQQYVPET